MGVLLPNGNDIEVINKLNRRFNDLAFSGLKDYVTNSGDDFLWGQQKTLHRASLRLKIHPTSGPRARGRWFAFLRTVLSDANRAAIKNAFQNAFQDTTGTIVGMQFWAQFDPSVTPAGTYEVQVTDVPADNAGHLFKRVTLLCDHDIGGGLSPDPDPGPDPGEDTSLPVNPDPLPDTTMPAGGRTRRASRAKAAKKAKAARKAAPRAKKTKKAAKARKK
jgi:hypothetical protein